MTGLIVAGFLVALFSVRWFALTMYRHRIAPYATAIHDETQATVIVYGRTQDEAHARALAVKQRRLQEYVAKRGAV